ncbi:MAG: stage III sporulation protein AE [Bacteroides sp.]|nr:stage III sporulation protein AE [Eubacterium sp.]MCM1418828.1 stage III sporulation protein AE [Roseburia sp.]MCM1462102.1 stage III sporulation protein AE [Bacteroides sp.]
MMFKKRLTIFLLTAVFSFLFLGRTAFAEPYDYGGDELYSALPDEARAYLDEKGITPDNNGAADLSIVEILSDLWDMFVENAEQPLKMFASIAAVILLTAVMSGLKGSFDQPKTDYAFTLVSSLAGTMIVAGFLSAALSGIDAALSAASDFLLAYVPVLAGVVAVGGQAATASVFTSVMMVVIELLTQAASKLLIPLSGMMLGVSAAGGLNPELKLDRIAAGLQKGIIWVLGLIMTVFIGVLTLQSSIASATDTFALRTARFAVSTGIPFVGGAVSEALATVKGSLSLVRSGIGSFGIVAVSCLLLPTMLHTLCYRLFLFLAEILSDLFSAEALGKIVRCGESVMSILIAIISCLFLFASVSTALLITVTRQ